MSQTYVTQPGDALDLICYRLYGMQAGAVEQVLEANPGIAAIAHALPEGVTLTLPDVDARAEAAQNVRLWT